jgi:LmbE family N-acetylglucosaminyl deacetylase
MTVRLTLLSAALLSAHPLIAATAPLPPKAIAQELRSFATVGTVLHVAAHPDDENTELITYLARGRGLRTAYLSLTRGDGGQNELGRDFDEKLGVLRTQELLAARKLDNGRQFFTRAIDFGYSKTPEETLQFWNRKEVLGDVVRIYRMFRPDVVVARFPVPPGSGGHGHHTASAMLAVEAFHLAGDPTAYPEQLEQGLTPWKPRRVLWNGFRFNPDAPLPLDGATFRQDIAGTDPVTGESFGMIAAHSRAMHKTQGLGGFATRARNGANEQTFVLLAGEAAAADLMDGVEVGWRRYAGGDAVSRLIDEALKQYDPAAPARIVPLLLEVRRKLREMERDPVIADKRGQLDFIIRSCLGVTSSSTVAHGAVVPGQEIEVTSRIDLPHRNGVRITGRTITVDGFAGAMQPRAVVKGAHLSLEPAATARFRMPDNTSLTQPYWLREEGSEGIARVSDPALIGLPENPASLQVETEIEVSGERITIVDDVMFIDGDKARRLDVVSPVSLEFASEVFVVAPGATKDVAVTVSAVHADERCTLRLEVPAGWRVQGKEQPFAIGAPGGRQRLTFQVTAPANPGTGRIAAVANVRGRDYSHQRQELRYAHLPVQLLQPPAAARLTSFPLELKGRSIGYLPGAGDYVAECLEQMGYAVTRLTGADLTADKLRRFDAVVIGVRAFNERDDLKENIGGLFAYVEQGGTVVAQYNRPNGLLTTQLGPYPLSIEGPAPRLRVTDERSAYSFIDPRHPVVTTPNRLGDSDFEGWVQERGAYFPSRWDEAKYEPVIAFNDPGEEPLRSGILVTRHGKGHYVYTGVAFFRQLPAGVPGAYRLFANLVSLGR